MRSTTSCPTMFRRIKRGSRSSTPSPGRTASPTTQHAIVADNISLVLAGFDPATKKYVGAEAVIKARIALVQADKKMSADDKKEELAELNEALKSPPPAVTIKANIDLVTKYYDKLAAALADDQE